MSVPTPAATDRQSLLAWYAENRRRSAEIFGLVDPEAYFERPIPLRHPFAFYEGHLPAFSFLVLCERGLGEPALDAPLERLFERGIDPGSLDDAHRQARTDWPEPDTLRAFARACDARVEAAIAGARFDDPGVPRLARAQALYTALEHEPMHHETLLYIVHQLDYSRKTPVAQRHADSTPPANAFLPIDAGQATLGADPHALPFGWDNEFGQVSVDVPAFKIQQYPVTNADWMAFVTSGGPVPPFWNKRNDRWYLRAAFEELPLPRSWPVYVTHRQATAYARWRGLRLPTEAEFHRAAFGAPDGSERPFPWGDALPEPVHGNFDFQRYDPEPVDAHPAGASAWGIQDLVGNGWEWTSTPFAPFTGFEPMASYPEYSADFFDGRHFVMKGASPVTSRRLIRRSLRNWFYDDYPYMYATFRCVKPSR